MSTTTTKLHPFEEAGMGRGPYTYAGFFDLAEARDPKSAANFGNMTGGIPDAPKLKSGLGTCACCGMGIMNICIVSDADGNLWGVGTDCIEKADEPHLGEKAQIDLKRKERRLRQARADKARESRRQAWLAAVNPETGETNSARLDREAKERAAAEEARKAAANARADRFADILPFLTGNDFYNSLAAQLKVGALSDRQAVYVAKAVHGRNTKANHDAFWATVERCTEVVK